MAKKTLEQLEADEKKLMEQLEQLRSGKKQIAADEANDALGILQDALSAYNKLAGAAGGKIMRLTSDAERDGTSSGKREGGGKRLRLKDEVSKDISEKIVKAVKAHGKDGANRADILKYLDANGYKQNHHFSISHYNKFMANLSGGDAPALVKTGDKSSTRYHIA